MNAKVVRRKKKASVKAPAKSEGSAMTPAEFEQAASYALGGRGWQKAWVRGTGQSPSTVTRYLQGVYPIPQYVRLILEMLASLRIAGLAVPESFSAEPMPGAEED